MGDVYVKPGGGGGVDCDNATAKASDILAGKNAGISGSDEPAAGTMPNQGAWNGSAAMNGSVSVPAGYHSGGGRVSGPSVPYQNAEVDGDRANATNISCAPGQINLGIRNGHYLNGVNWIKGSLPNLTAANIKKGVNIGGVVGTWEGYVSPIVFFGSSGLTSYSANGVTPVMYSGKTSSVANGLSYQNGRVRVATSRYVSSGTNPGLQWSGGFFNDAFIVTAYNYVSVTFANTIGLPRNTFYLSVGLSTNPRAFSQDVRNATVEYPCSGTVEATHTLTFNISDISGWQYLLLYAAGTWTANLGYFLYIKEIRFY